MYKEAIRAEPVSHHVSGLLDSLSGRRKNCFSEGWFVSMGHSNINVSVSIYFALLTILPVRTDSIGEHLVTKDYSYIAQKALNSPLLLDSSCTSLFLTSTERAWNRFVLYWYGDHEWERAWHKSVLYRYEDHKWYEYSERTSVVCEYEWFIRRGILSWVLVLFASCIASARFYVELDGAAQYNDTQTCVMLILTRDFHFGVIQTLVRLFHSVATIHDFHHCVVRLQVIPDVEIVTLRLFLQSTLRLRPSWIAFSKPRFIKPVVLLI